MNHAASILILCLMLTGCGSLLHTGPMAEVTGAKMDEYASQSKENDVEVESGSNVQTSKDVQMSGDGTLVMLRDIAPWAFGAVIILALSRAFSNLSMKWNGHIEGNKRTNLTRMG